MAIRMVNTPQMRARRWTAAIVVAIAVVIGPQAISHAAAANADAAATEGAPVTDTYVVGQGETLWSIAASLTPAGADVRDTVDVIKTMNRLESADLGIGDQLLVPLAG